MCCDEQKMKTVTVEQWLLCLTKIADAKLTLMLNRNAVMPSRSVDVRNSN